MYYNLQYKAQKMQGHSGGGYSLTFMLPEKAHLYYSITSTLTKAGELLNSAVAPLLSDCWPHIFLRNVPLHVI